MRRRDPDRPAQIGGFWLSKRPNSTAWCRTWFDATTRQTRRTSLGTDDLDEAERRLAAYVAQHVATDRADPRDVTLARLFLRYQETHGRHVIGADAQRVSLAMILRHTEPGLTAGAFTLATQGEAVRAMQAAGYGAGTIKRAFGAAKAACNHAWKNGEIDRPLPFLSLQDGEGRERVLDVAELRRLWDAPMPAHVRVFVALMLATGARPEAALQLTRFQCDLDRGFIDLNPPGRVQTKKRRAILPLPDWLRPWISATPHGHLVAWRGRPVKKIAGAFQTVRDAAGFGDDVTSYTLRHTVATELMRRGVPELEIATVLGHRVASMRTTGRYLHASPDHLAHARRALDDLAKDIGRAATRPMEPETSRLNVNQRASCVAELAEVVCNPTRKPLILGAGVGTVD